MLLGLYECVRLPKLIKLYDLCLSLKVNFTSIKNTFKK